jgi:hypothetical protein
MKQGITFNEAVAFLENCRSSIDPRSPVHQQVIIQAIATVNKWAACHEVTDRKRMLEEIRDIVLPEPATTVSVKPVWRVA